MYLLEQLDRYDIVGEKIKLVHALKGEQGVVGLLPAINDSDIIIFSIPLYVDSTPAIVIKAMELIARERKVLGNMKKQKLVALCNSGFPESHQNQTALDIFKHFANEAGFEWAGGLALGCGGAIEGRPLKSLGGMVRNVVMSLDLTAKAIGEGKNITEEAIKTMAKPLVPSWLYVIFGQLGWKSQAKKYGVHKSLDARPYEQN